MTGATMASLSLQSTAASLLAPGKGILAADESLGTITRRFEALGIVSNAELRQAYRGLLFTTPSLNEHISGAILFDETMRQTIGTTPIPEALARKGIIPGIKVDEGTEDLPRFPGEKLTKGLDGLRERLLHYRDMGARFTKWRAVVALGEHLPTCACIEANAHRLAHFAALSQEAGLVPIVEPEVLMDGIHTLARCEEATGRVLGSVFAALTEYRVSLEAMLLKTGMVLPGKDCPEQEDNRAIAQATIRCLRRAVPAAVPGIVFLSGGQSAAAATERLNAICTAAAGPWTLTFSFGRALQDDAMKAWRGDPANTAVAQEALRRRAECNGLAVQGRYSERDERGPSRYRD